MHLVNWCKAIHFVGSKWQGRSCHLSLGVLDMAKWFSGRCTMNFQWKKKVPWNGALSMRSPTGSWETRSICITLRHKWADPADMHANVLVILMICRFPLVYILPYMRTGNCFSDIMCHLVDISHQYKIVFMSSTTLQRAVSRVWTWIAAVRLWVILLSDISSDCSWRPAWRVESFVSNGRWLYW